MSLCYILKASLALRLVSVSKHTVVMGLLLAWYPGKISISVQILRKLNAALTMMTSILRDSGKPRYMYVFFLPNFKLWSKSDAHSSLWTNMIVQRLSKGSISFSETAQRKNFGLQWSFSSVFIWKQIAWIYTYIRTNCLRC